MSNGVKSYLLQLYVSVNLVIYLSEDNFKLDVYLGVIFSF